MVMQNKIKSFVDGLGITVYQFRQQTSIANKTAYDLYNNPLQYPGRDVMDKICSAFKVQPGELLEWVPENQTGNTTTNKDNNGEKQDD